MLALPLAPDCNGSNAEARIIQPLDSLQLQTVRAFIDDNMPDKLTLAQIADQVHLSVSYLAPRFKSSTGVSLHQYIISRRLERARELVKASDRSIADIAASVGFADHSHLTRTYKKEFGVTPLLTRRSSPVASV